MLITISGGNPCESLSLNKRESGSSSEEESMILIPPGCLNGFHTISKSSTYLYNLSYDGEYIDSADQITLSWNDPRINLKLTNPKVQEKDKTSNS